MMAPVQVQPGYDCEQTNIHSQRPRPIIRASSQAVEPTLHNAGQQSEESEKPQVLQEAAKVEPSETAPADVSTSNNSTDYEAVTKPVRVREPTGTIITEAVALPEENKQNEAPETPATLGTEKASVIQPQVSASLQALLDREGFSVTEIYYFVLEELEALEKPCLLRQMNEEPLQPPLRLRPSKVDTKCLAELGKKDLFHARQTSDMLVCLLWVFSEAAKEKGVDEFCPLTLEDILLLYLVLYKRAYVKKGQNLAERLKIESEWPYETRVVKFFLSQLCLKGLFNCHMNGTGDSPGTMVYELTSLVDTLFQ